MKMAASEIVAFWLQAGPAKWFEKDPAFDETIRARFLTYVEAALGGQLGEWMESDQGALALVLVLDQFTRNIWREDARAFSGDEIALACAQDAIGQGVDLRLSEVERRWLYMPFMHSERLEAQKAGMVYFSTRLDDPNTLAYAQLHLDIVERFGRFPHRNQLLGRETSEAEQAFLDDGGFKG
ncbi:MAG: DUF924 domain-containing protein [Alphaproteobacteria bacterium]|nr:DUF924 domain-containing protein [Alphaproteobacteria bacterium]MBO6628430.1 DUF924 domain-containing protein [Alphaproteobacteria bacterium]MDF1626093.1 DUF924 domain-containing protein [Parvibaculaceae bacterium]|tara:strand:- start:717 stop:1262 length:546 start_codon:yes stop_codon:yes gene_type:complete